MEVISSSFGSTWVFKPWGHKNFLLVLIKYKLMGVKSALIADEHDIVLVNTFAEMEPTAKSAEQGYLGRHEPSPVK